MSRIFALKQGCLVILFTNFLALVIKAGVASKDSSGSAAYSVALIIVNVLFFLSIWGNAWATAKATFSRRHAQVCGRTEPPCGSFCHVMSPRSRKA